MTTDPNIASVSASSAAVDAEAALRSSEKRYRDLVETSHDLIWSVDAEGRWTFVNRRGALAIYGYEPEEMLGRPFTEFQSTEQMALDLQVFEQIKAGQPVFGYETQHRRKDGRIAFLSFNAVPLADAEGKVVGTTGTARDITDQMRIEERIRTSQKLEALGQLAGGVAHDFNNLLTVIAGYCDLLLGALAAEASERQPVAEIRSAAARAASLTRQLLAFGRKQILEPKIVNLNAVVADMETMLRRLIGADVELATRLDADIGNVRVDPSQIEQVVLNLAVNARDAMPAGGKLTIETGRARIEGDERHSAVDAKPGEYATLAVTDTGIGIAPEIRKHVFEPFFTTKAPGKGTGLGLASVYGIVKQSEGFVSLESEVGRGAKFRVWLPAVDAALDSAPTVATPIPAKGTETILLVEDETSVRGLFRRVLSAQGYRVIEAGHAQEAEEFVRTQGAAIDLVVTDVVMPGLSGVKFAEQVRLRHPRIKVLMMSGYAEDANARRGLHADTAFLQKPFSPAELTAKVRELLKGPPP